MKIGGIQHFTLVDFPDNPACIIFTQGCNLRCRMCHNPELIYKELFREPMDEGDVKNFLRRRGKLLKGVVFSGGECTIQPDLAEWCGFCKELGYKVKIDTNGTRPRVVKTLILNGLVDYVALDVKCTENLVAKVVQPVSDEVDYFNMLEQSIEVVTKTGIPHMFRTTVPSALEGNQDFINAVKRMLPSKSTLVLQKELHLGVK